MADQLIKTSSRVYFGADPEIFLTLDGVIVGSEKAIGEDGLPGQEMDNSYGKGHVSVIRDGVQIELNIPPTHCREWFVNEIKAAFSVLHKHLDDMKEQKFEISFRQLVEVSPEELASLTPLSQRLGCQPSFNWYHPGATIGVDPATYLKRSAGGHIHLGLPPHLMSERAQLAPLLDVLLGNTSVLVDRNPDAAERRQVYGRAGEFRLPRHGFEYRTLSNYWLRHKNLVSFVLGLARMAVFVLDTAVSQSDTAWPADEVLMNLINMGDIEKAINNSDVDLAKSNFAKIRPFIERHVPIGRTVADNETSLDPARLAGFDTFIDGIDKGGIERWYPDDPITHWQTTSFLGGGWEYFLDHIQPPQGAE